MEKATAEKGIASRKEETVEQDADNQVKESSGPVWKTQHHRVQGAMWRHVQDGKTRFTIAITRSYKDQEDGQWRNVHYFDRRDMSDVRAVCEDAEKHLRDHADMTAAVDKD